jgi:hypothetical protein
MHFGAQSVSSPCKALISRIECGAASARLSLQMGEDQANMPSGSAQPAGRSMPKCSASTARASASLRMGRELRGWIGGHLRDFIRFSQD